MVLTRSLVVIVFTLIKEIEVAATDVDEVLNTPLIVLVVRVTPDLFC